jgi:hypothetical protein
MEVLTCFTVKVNMLRDEGAVGTVRRNLKPEGQMSR